MPRLGLSFVGLRLRKTQSLTLVEGLGWAWAGLRLKPRLQSED